MSVAGQAIPPATNFPGQTKAPVPLEHLARLLEYPHTLTIPAESLESLQELYTRTFDLNPECSLEAGWHLFGEEYERGSFLVKMREELRRHGIPESTELPDHLTHALRLAARMEPGEARAFSEFILPAVDKMLAGLAGKNNPYEDVLKAVRAALAQGAAECLART